MLPVTQVYVKAKECSEQLSAENFAILLARHFTSFYKQVITFAIEIVTVEITGIRNC